ncbi:hypothetical protein RND71_032420 [Anisodus tanguticus]|uniref:Uncharacterized protein n=1 Tax=Anisodus tanguticus TaxID=243964 RepID=A0AAE1RDM8_9SOLA|nr:hypothetical protein RND71_032420 [Anisodus tanguticus]
MVKKVIDECPHGRLGQSEDVAPVVGFLAGDASEWVNGQIIRVNGAISGVHYILCSVCFDDCWIKRWQQATKGTLFEKILTLMNFAYTLLVLSYSAVGFMVLSLHETLTSYGSVYYIGTIIPIVLILLGKVIKPARLARSKARKEE